MILKTEPINQIKNVSQEKKVKSELQNDVKAQEKLQLTLLIIFC